MELPKHTSLSINHIGRGLTTGYEHHNYYESVDQLVSDYNLTETFVSPEDYRKCIETDSLWVIQWYPDTPIGSYIVSGSTLEICMSRVMEIERNINGA